ncbi:MAG: cupin-like domain-containing protein [Deltaproteobacteria bacterium]|nr:cupin-like domain-containing protein [Deltaproteobacteria bacterium]
MNANPKTASPSQPQSAFNFDPAEFGRKYNRAPFLFRHNLVDHPLLQLPKLAELALRMDPQHILHRSGRVPPDTNFDHAHELHPARTSLAYTLEHIAESGSAVTINTPELDAEYKPFIASLYEEVRQATEPIDPGITYTAAYIFIAAPGSLTPYHMDREMNFLIHLRGKKVAQLWDPADPAVMSPEDVDQLFARFDIPRPGYRPELDAKAMTFDLLPGQGVHHPFIAPHLVRTTTELAISLAVTFRTRASDRIAQLHNVNHRLRKLGLAPRAVGTDPRADAAKLAAYHLGQPVLGAAWRLARRLGVR